MTTFSGTDLKRFYDILGVDPDASMEEIRQAYKDLVNVWHPDRFNHSPRLRLKAEEQLKAINGAFQTLQEHRRSAEAAADATPKPPRPSAKQRLLPPVDKNTAPRYAAVAAAILVLVAGAFFFVRQRRPAEPGLSSAGGHLETAETTAETDHAAEHRRIDAWIASLKRRIENARRREAEWRDTAPDDAATEDSSPKSDDALSSREHRTLERLLERRHPENQPRPIRPGPRDVVPDAPKPSPETVPDAPGRPDLSATTADIKKRLAHSSRFHVMESGVVIDRRTGLTWCLRNSLLESGRYMDYKAAVQYVRNLHTGGYRDWRLPTSGELAAIYLNRPFFPASDDHWFWTSETFHHGWHRTARVIRPRNREKSERLFRRLEEAGIAHAVRP